MDPVQLVIEWLSEATAYRAASNFEAGQGFPRIVVYSASGAPLPGGQGDQPVSEYQVSIYCVGGREAENEGDLPDYPLAWVAAREVRDACAALRPFRPYVGQAPELRGARLQRARMSSQARSTDTATGYARVTMTLALDVAER